MDCVWIITSFYLLNRFGANGYEIEVETQCMNEHNIMNMCTYNRRSILSENYVLQFIFEI